MRRSAYAALALLSVAAMLLSTPATAWSNSGQSADPGNPNYGTHDWLAEHALDFLPENETSWLTAHRATYLYGTELPDFDKSAWYMQGIGDQTNHHVYFNEDGSIFHDNSARRAQEEADLASAYLREGDYEAAALHAGIMTHYIADLTVFGHVMGYYTTWMQTRADDGGSEGYYNHMTYEQYVNLNTSSYESAEWEPYLRFDGTLSHETVYQIVIKEAYNTTFAPGSYLDCVYIDEWLYDHPWNSTERWGDKAFHDRTGILLNLAVNSIADALHRVYVDSGVADAEEPPAEPKDYLHLDSLWLLLPFCAVLLAVFAVTFRYIF